MIYDLFIYKINKLVNNKGNIFTSKSLLKQESSKY